MIFWSHWKFALKTLPKREKNKLNIFFAFKSFKTSCSFVFQDESIEDSMKPKAAEAEAEEEATEPESEDKLENKHTEL